MKSALKPIMLSFVGAFIASCGSVQDDYILPTKPRIKIITEEVTIDPKYRVAEVVDQNDLQACIAYAAQLSDSGEHSKSAKVYLDIGKRFNSSKLKQHCQNEAFKQLYLAGDIAGCRELLSKIDDSENIYSSQINKDIRKFRDFLNQEDLTE